MNNSDIEKTLQNPFYCIDLSEGLVGSHEKLVSKKNWIESNKKLIVEIGIEKWLQNLLEILEGDYTKDE